MLIRPSPLGATLVGTVHAAAACAVIAVLPGAAALVCTVGLALSATVHVGTMLQWWRSSVRELALRPDGAAAWREADGSWHAASEIAGAVLASWLIAIGLKEDGGRLRPMLLLPDALEPSARRELRVWLRWRPPIAPSGQSRDLRHAMAKDPAGN